jgi:IS6 family transposase
MAEMAIERGLAIDASCIWRWVQVYGPELDKRCRRHLKQTNRSWRLDETYINVKGRDRFLYRAVDSTGQTIDFLVTDRRDAEAAKRFFRRALLNEGNSMPRVINVDKNPAYPRAVEELKADGTIRQTCHLRQCKYLNNVVEQSHRNVKRGTWLAKGYGSLATAWRTLRGIEAMDMVRKGRVRWVAKDDAVSQANFISKLFDVAA